MKGIFALLLKATKETFMSVNGKHLEKRLAFSQRN